MIIGDDSTNPEPDDDGVIVRFIRALQRYAIIDDCENILEVFSPSISGNFISQRAREIDDDNSIIIYDAFGARANRTNGGNIIIP